MQQSGVSRHVLSRPFSSLQFLQVTLHFGHFIEMLSDTPWEDNKLVRSDRLFDTFTVE